MIGMLLSYAAFEKHVLIFHNSLVNTRRKHLILWLHSTMVWLCLFYKCLCYSYIWWNF